jgi:hypothetical protein
MHDWQWPRSRPHRYQKMPGSSFRAGIVGIVPSSFRKRSFAHTVLQDGTKQILLCADVECMPAAHMQCMQVTLRCQESFELVRMLSRRQHCAHHSVSVGPMCPPPHVQSTAVQVAYTLAKQQPATA